MYYLKFIANAKTPHTEINVQIKRNPTPATHTHGKCYKNSLSFFTISKISKNKACEFCKF